MKCWHIVLMDICLISNIFEHIFICILGIQFSLFLSYLCTFLVFHFDFLYFSYSFMIHIFYHSWKYNPLSGRCITKNSPNIRGIFLILVTLHFLLQRGRIPLQIEISNINININIKHLFKKGTFYLDFRAFSMSVFS